MFDSTVIPEALIDALWASRHVCVLSGSGTSAESGAPTFREAQTGPWEKFDAHELATPEAFLCDPEVIWRWSRVEGCVVKDGSDVSSAVPTCPTCGGPLHL